MALYIAVLPQCQTGGLPRKTAALRASLAPLAPNIVLVKSQCQWKRCPRLRQHLPQCRSQKTHHQQQALTAENAAGMPDALSVMAEIRAKDRKVVGRAMPPSAPTAGTKVKGGAAALQQHTWWNETCLAWQFFRQGYSWAKSKEMAERLKEDRMVEGGPSDDDGPDSANPPPRPDKSWVPTRRSPPRRKEKKEKKHKEPKMWKVRKNEKKKRKKNKKSSRSPSPVRERKKRPPSSSSSGGGKKGREGRAKKEKPRTLVIRL